MNITYCENVAFAMASLWDCDIIYIPGLLIFIFQPSSSILERLYPLGLLNCSTFDTHG